MRASSTGPGNADKFPGVAKPNPSYHGVVFTEAAGEAAYITKARATLLRDQGATLSPFNAFILLQGLETLSLRVERHVENALKVVDFLSKHPQVERVNHPSLSTGRAKELYDEYSSQRSCFHLHVRDQGHGRDRLQVHREPEAVQPARERGGCEKPRHPPGVDHALAANRQGA